MKKQKNVPTSKKISVIKSNSLFKDLLVIGNFIDLSEKENDDKEVVSWRISPLLKKVVEDFIKDFIQNEDKKHPITNNDEFVKFKKDYGIIKENNQKNTTFDLPIKEHSELEQIAKELDMVMSELIKSIFFNYKKNHESELKLGKEILAKLEKSSKIKKEVKI